LKAANGVTVKQDDLSDASKTAATIRGADAVVSAYAPPPDNTDAIVAVTERQIKAVKQAGVGRLVVVGGAGGLEISPGVSLIDSGYLPEPYLPIATAHVKALNALRASDVDWTYFAPAGFFEPGERTGKFRLGTNELISNDKGESRISMEDYAIALVDELENPKHRKQRFSIGY
jgi:putative NADH-flavin reductase